MSKPNPFLALLAKDLAKKTAVDSQPKPAVEATASGSSALSSVNPLMTLTAPLPPEPDSPKTFETIEHDADEGKLMPSGVHEIANINTESMEPESPQKYKLPETNRKAMALTKGLILEDAPSVRKLCDDIDAVIEANESLAGPPLITLRGYVTQLMVTLKERPEFDSVLIAKDTRNVMKYVRANREDSLVLRDIKVEKKAAKTVRASKKSKTDQLMGDAFAKMLGGFKL